MAFSVQNSSTKAFSVYGGTGGQGTYISPFKPRLFCGTQPPYNPFDDQIFYISGNEKSIMKNLNDRLASFLQKVHSLQSKNAELEKKIMEWCTSQTVVSHDYSGYLATIKSLQDQIQQITKSNCASEICIKNTTLAANDIRNKYEFEQYIRMSVEKDSAHSRKIMDEITLARSVLEQEYESMREERIKLEMSHEEEIVQIHEQAGGQVEVSVDAAPSTDLSETLMKIREQYEAAADKHQNDLEAWYERKISTIERKRMVETEDLEHVNTELRQLNSYFHRLQIQLETQHSMSTGHGDSIREKLAELNKILAEKSPQLQQIRENITQTKQEYDVLLEVHNNLETEINEYRLLLEAKGSDAKVTLKKIAVIKVVESCETLTQN
ncbi:hypothetical protein HF521_022689 [Silurus meridionalis]|uniref:IF rod domain-containing protein n=1 Tax=Silurus meridionalis TaxID=175797 RepID=A0A8T0B9Z0_SILME|nr:hypothetical protein HF521_022689 [Silurus meridionalis]